MRDKIEIEVRTTDNYMITGVAWADSLTLSEAVHLGCPLQDPATQLDLIGEYTVVATEGGPKVCITWAKLHGNGGSTLELNSSNCNMDMLLDDIQLTETQHNWEADMAETYNEGDR